MAENEAIQEEQTVDESPQGETETTETDWKAEARKWERYAKKAQAAEQELEQLKAAQMTEQEKAIARAEEAEKKLAELQAQEARNKAAREIADSEGVPLSLLEYCADADAMAEFAKEYKAQQVSVHAAASANGARLVKGSSKPNTEETEFVKNLFR